VTHIFARRFTKEEWPSDFKQIRIFARKTETDVPYLLKRYVQKCVVHQRLSSYKQMSELFCRPLPRWQPQHPIRRRNRQEENQKQHLTGLPTIHPECVQRTVLCTDLRQRYCQHRYWTGHPVHHCPRPHPPSQTMPPNQSWR